ncbi:CheR family methyltransferase [Pseudogemmobacter faecipullorum]|uniref:Protein-glutamate O-methyltransferase CheR n=1 Tax=Pseudogemmobacter faecipullorum TaxID=2755041 RepID=A0ABS8CPE5_9RHOB|nr:CheR family methyltransferase [Pseudogemmobacter faecipullorum]MCB5411252.1 protein-glutamate O-methyltransferase CheR [Pseudogemmobacter faecipullorum]
MTAQRRLADPVRDIELDLFLQALNRRYHYDFSAYARSSVQRRVEVARSRLGCETISQMQGRLLREPALLHDVIDAMTVQVSDLFRDPGYYLALRQEVLPYLRTFPSLKVWVAGCANGEELYSLAILFAEEGLLERTMFYATEINRRALSKAAAGIYETARIPRFSENYQAAGGRTTLSDYYTAAYRGAAFHRHLRQRTLFSEHDLATDEVFSEMHLISCRNVMIYFDETLQNRVLGLFAQSLVRGGFIGLGAHETLRFSDKKPAFTSFNEQERIWRRSNLSELHDV